jgi:hypothetical protein
MPGITPPARTVGFVAFGDVGVVESPFGLDASLTVLLAGDAMGAVGLHSTGNSNRLPGLVV